MPATRPPLQSTSSAQVFGRGWLQSVGAVLEVWQRRCRSRCELARLISSGPHLIEDIGLPREHADREVAKPFWRP